MAGKSEICRNYGFLLSCMRIWIISSFSPCWNACMPPVAWIPFECCTLTTLFGCLMASYATFYDIGRQRTCWYRLPVQIWAISTKIALLYRLTCWWRKSLCYPSESNITSTVLSWPPSTLFFRFPPKVHPGNSDSGTF